MKKLLSTIFLFFPVLLFAQSKIGGLIKEHLYLKVSPALLAGVTNDPKLLNEDAEYPAVFGALGVKTRYAALGYSAGCIFFSKREQIGEKGPGPTAAPWGVDLTITDFKRIKIFPVITAQYHKIHFTEYSSSGNGTSGGGSYATGKEMYSLGAGIAIPVFKTSKILATLGFSRINATGYTAHSNPYPSPGTVTYLDDHADIFTITASWVW